MPDLITNLLLNDTQFKRGLQNAGVQVTAFGKRVDENSGLTAFAKQANKASGDLTRLAGVFTMAGARAMAIQTVSIGVSVLRELNSTVEDSDDAFTKFSKSAPLAIRLINTAMNGLVIDLGVEMTKLIEKTDPIKMVGRLSSAFSGNPQLESRALDIRDQLDLVKETDAYEKEMIRLKQEETRIRIELNSVAKRESDMYKAAIGDTQELLRLKADLIRQDQERADALRSYNAREAAEQAMLSQLDRRSSIEEMLAQEQIALLRAQGKDDDAERARIRLDYERKIRDIQKDTESGYDDAKKQSIIDQLTASRDQLLGLVGQKAPSLTTRALSAPTASALFAQTFSGGSTRQEFDIKKLREAAEKQTEEQKRQTEYLKRIANARPGYN